MLTQLRKKREEGGFTLIELLIVIIILGILAAVVVLSINAIRDRGAESACETEAEQIRVALAGTFSDNGEYPTDETFLNNDSDDPTNAGIRNFLDGDFDTVTWVYESPTGDTYTLDGETAEDCEAITGLSEIQGVDS